MSRKNWREARKKPLVFLFREVCPEKLIRVKHKEDGSKEEVWGEAIETEKGTLFAYPDRNFIIREEKGEEVYPIRKDIFHQTYDIIIGESEVRVLVEGYLRCPKCGHTDNAVERGSILDGVFCCTFMEPVGTFVIMSHQEWMQKHESFRSTSGWEKNYQMFEITLEMITKR